MCRASNNKETNERKTKDKMNKNSFISVNSSQMSEIFIYNLNVKFLYLHITYVCVSLTLTNKRSHKLTHILCQCIQINVWTFNNSKIIRIYL